MSYVLKILVASLALTTMAHAKTATCQAVLHQKNRISQPPAVILPIEFDDYNEGELRPVTLVQNKDYQVVFFTRKNQMSLAILKKSEMNTPSTGMMGSSTALSNSEVIGMVYNSSGQNPVYAQISCAIK